jgi:hypothetical protein
VRKSLIILSGNLPRLPSCKAELITGRLLLVERSAASPCWRIAVALAYSGTVMKLVHDTIGLTSMSTDVSFDADQTLSVQAKEAHFCVTNRGCWLGPCQPLEIK